MIVADAIQVVVACDVERDSILIEHRGAGGGYSCAEPATSASVGSQSKIYRMAGIELEETSQRPAAQSMTHDTLLRLKERQFIGHIELVSVSVIFRTSSIGQMRQRIGDVVVRSSA